MKKKLILGMKYLIAISILVPASVNAQNEKGDKGEKGDKEVQQIIITRTGDHDKMIVEVNGDKVTVNGMPLDELKGKHDDIKVKINKYKQLESLSRIPGRGNDWNDVEGFMRLFRSDENENKAMLGVSTEKDDDGAEIESVTKGSAAEKAGLKEDDVITKINDTKITSPDDLSNAIKNKTRIRLLLHFCAIKKNKVTAELTKWEGVSSFENNFKDLNLNLEGLNFDRVMPRVTTPGYPSGPNMHWSGGSPKLGISVQDTDDGKGVKVIEVDDESNADKAGIEEEDVITKVDDKAVNSVDEIARLLREKKDNPTVSLQLTRKGKSQTIEVKMPRKIKTADL
jgi:serine protease Do